MFHKFEGNQVNFGIVYYKNRISRSLDCKNLNWMAKIQPPPPPQMALGGATKMGRLGKNPTTLESTNECL